jgi:hypothetical protein
VRGLHKSGQLIRRNHRNPATTMATHNHDFVIVGNTIQHRSQSLPKVLYHSYRSFAERTGFLYVNDQSAPTALGTGRGTMALQSRKTFGKMAARAITVQTTVSIPVTPRRKTAGIGMIIRDTVKTMAKG